MNRHPLDALSLLFGLLFATIGLLHLTGSVDVGEVVTDFWPLALVGLGLTLLYNSRRSD